MPARKREPAARASNPVPKPGFWETLSPTNSALSAVGLSREGEEREAMAGEGDLADIADDALKYETYEQVP